LATIRAPDPAACPAPDPAAPVITIWPAA